MVLCINYISLYLLNCHVSNLTISLFFPLIQCRAHLPQTIADLSFENVHEAVPEQYIKNGIASCIASKMVYKEGTKFIESQPKGSLAKIALNYIEKEKEIVALKNVLSETEMPDAEKESIMKLLDAGGARTALNMV